MTMRRYINMLFVFAGFGEVFMFIFQASKSTVSLIANASFYCDNSVTAALKA